MAQNENYSQVDLRIGTEAQFNAKVDTLPAGTLFGITDATVSKADLSTDLKNEINGKINKPTNPSAESAVTMLADGTVGTKPLSEIAELVKLYQHTYTFEAGTHDHVYCTTYKNSNTPMTAEEVINFFKSDLSVGKVVNVVVDNNETVGSGYFFDAGEGIDYIVIILNSSADFMINADTYMTTNIIEL